MTRPESGCPSCGLPQGAARADAGSGGIWCDNSFHRPESEERYIKASRKNQKWHDRIAEQIARLRSINDHWQARAQRAERRVRELEKTLNTERDAGEAAERELSRALAVLERLVKATEGLDEDKVLYEAQNEARALLSDSDAR